SYLNRITPLSSEVGPRSRCGRSRLDSPAEIIWSKSLPLTLACVIQRSVRTAFEPAPAGKIQKKASQLITSLLGAATDPSHGIRDWRPSVAPGCANLTSFISSERTTCWAPWSRDTVGDMEFPICWSQ